MTGVQTCALPIYVSETTAGQGRWETKGAVLNAGADGIGADLALGQAGCFNTTVLAQGHPAAASPSSSVMCGENLWLSQLGGRGPWNQMGAARDAAKPHTVPRRGPQQRMTRPE